MKATKTTKLLATKMMAARALAVAHLAAAEAADPTLRIRTVLAVVENGTTKAAMALAAKMTNDFVAAHTA